MLESKRTDAYASAELGNSGIKSQIVSFAKIGFWIVTVLLAFQIFLKAVYFANL